LTGQHCALGSSAEICTVYFSAAKAGRDIVSAGYPDGDKRYAPSYGYTTVTVTA
jgi:hypothetical protein